MKFTSFVLAASAVACAAAAKVTRCGTNDPPPTLKQALDQTAFRYSFYRNGSRTVNTYVHVVTTEEKDGAYTQANVDAQMDAMNSAYGPSGFSFNLLDTDFTVNDEWATAGQGTQAELDMKTELHQGSYADLNLYFLSDLGGGLLGFCYFPEENPTDEELILDGCINIAGSMPGLNELPDYNLGLTAVHEAGHWFGLFHVFQGSSCSGKGDYISDTPAQSAPTDGCPTTSDTCPDQPGVDSIHNYMDYSYDECLDEFTQKQGQRMFSIYDQYRAGK